MSESLKKRESNTSSALMYSEYINVNESKTFERLLAKKPEKPIIVSCGESPMFKKYSELLKKLEETKDEFPPESDESSPMIQISCLIKQKVDGDTDSEEDETPFGFSVIDNVDSDEDTSNEETSNKEFSTKKSVKKIEVIDENNVTNQEFRDD